MINILNSIKKYIKTFDSIDTYTDGTFRYYTLDNPFFSGYFPEGRFVFYYDKNQISNLEIILKKEMKLKNINAFKYAIEPLSNEINPAIIIYAKKSEKENIEKIIKNIKINDYIWIDGNPFTVSNIMTDYKK